MFCETRKLAEEWTYRWLAAALTWARAEPAASARIGAAGAPAASARIGAADAGATPIENDGPAPGPSTAEIRTWARAHGIAVPDRGRLRPEVHEAWHAAHRP